jgi:hypothetical protein
MIAINAQNKTQRTFTTRSRLLFDFTVNSFPWSLENYFRDDASLEVALDSPAYCGLLAGGSGLLNSSFLSESFLFSADGDLSFLSGKP